MAKVEHPLQKEPKTDAEWIDHWLYSALEEWQELGEIEAEFASWSAIDQITFIEEWPLAEMRLEYLECYAREDRMTPEQQRRYQDLLELVKKNRPVIERLRGPRVGASEI
jgi:hypothetical protein